MDLLFLLSPQLDGGSQDVVKTEIYSFMGLVFEAFRL